MIHYRIDKRFHVLGAGVQSVSSLWPAAAAAEGWWTSGGATGCVAAYQPKGAASYAASLTDLSGSGNNATEGTAPSWDSTNGWTFNGTDQYLDTNVVPVTGTCTLIVRYSDAGLVNNTSIAGVKAEFNRYTYIRPSNGFGALPLSNGAVTAFSGEEAASGVVGVAGLTGYKNGSSLGALTSGAGLTSRTCYIGAERQLSNPGGYSACKVQAFALYTGTLDAATVAAVSTAMAAL